MLHLKSGSKKDAVHTSSVDSLPENRTVLIAKVANKINPVNPHATAIMVERLWPSNESNPGTLTSTLLVLDTSAFLRPWEIDPDEFNSGLENSFSERPIFRG